jgi:hypothetical protein
LPKGKKRKRRKNVFSNLKDRTAVKIVFHKGTAM